MADWVPLGHDRKFVFIHSFMSDVLDGLCGDDAH